MGTRARAAGARTHNAGTSRALTQAPRRPRPREEEQAHGAGKTEHGTVDEEHARSLKNYAPGRGGEARTAQLCPKTVLTVSHLTLNLNRAFEGLNRRR